MEEINKTVNKNLSFSLNGTRNTNLLAYIALGCTILGFVTGITFLPGLVCGGIAMYQYRADNSIGGWGAALSSVIISGTVIGLAILAGVAVVMFIITVNLFG
jgi:hypothetical protein